ncbi:hypothetical protein NW766_000265 [Fusarium irregulare]|uniref:Uncharacterized protein n=1 Tax=Fusarium irregulare TaxID=2494466 RepID=A0A9W8Q1A7_9HYPO|nr:hypothetical protein NW766_000265 [Fusarium irregulare]
MPNPLKASYHFLTWILDHDQVPNDIRRSLELVRTCDSDLQHLIELRNDCLPLLQRRPKVLQRVHTIIESAQKGLQEVCEIVERCRPENDRGTRTTFSKRMAWVLVESSEFKSQEPIVSRHHAAVLAELNFLRQIALMAPVSEPEKREEKKGIVKEAAVFDNVALLGDLLGDMKVFNANTEPMTHSDISSLQLPTSLHRKSSSQTFHMEHAHDSLPEVLPVDMASTVPSRSLTTNSKCDSKDLAGLALLLGDPLDFQNCSTPSPISQRGGMQQSPAQSLTYGPPSYPSLYTESNQHLPYNPQDSVSDLSQGSHNAYTPSSLSNTTRSLHHSHSSLSILSSTPRIPNQHHQSYPSNYPGQLMWRNSSSTTIAIASPDYRESNTPFAHPIAELDTSPYQRVPLSGALSHNNSSSGQKLAVQVNTTPVELSAEEKPTSKPSLRRQAMRIGSSRSGRAFSEPSQQHKRRPPEGVTRSTETGTSMMQSQNSTL